MTIAKLMADSKAANIYATLSPRSAPDYLADQYLQGKLAGDKSLCLALECHIRDLARVHFHRPEVLDALATMERCKARRKPGNSAPKELQSIADSIARRYAMGTFERLDDGRIRFSVPVAADGHLRVTCKDSPGAVAWVVAKYRAGIPKSRAGRYGSINA